MRIDHYIHIERSEDERQAEAQFRADVLRKLNLIGEEGIEIMATLDDVISDVADEGTKVDGLVALNAGLKQQIADALSGVTLPPNVQAKVDAVFAGVEANKAKIAAALDAVPPAAA